LSNGFETPLHIPLRFDKRLALINHAAHLATGVILGFVQAPIWLLLLVLFGLVASHRYCAMVHVRRTHPAAIVLLVLESDGSWTLYRRRAQILRNVGLKTCFVHPDYIIAYYAFNSRRGWSVILTREATDPVTFRRLKMHLGGQRCIPVAHNGSR
jgi:hypothetical protein